MARVSPQLLEPLVWNRCVTPVSRHDRLAGTESITTVTATVASPYIPAPSRPSTPATRRWGTARLHSACAVIADPSTHQRATYEGWTIV